MTYQTFINDSMDFMECPSESSRRLLKLDNVVVKFIKKHKCIRPAEICGGESG